MTHDPRRELILTWLTEELHLAIQSLEPASADASFRRYFRASLADGSTRIVMDAPPAHEDIRPFLSIDKHLAACGVHVPHIDAYSIEHGLMLLEDLGNTPYLTALQITDLTPSPLAGEGWGEGADKNQTPPPSNARPNIDTLYTDALRALRHLQTCPSADLPAYDAAKLTSEMQLFETWYLRQHLGLNLNDNDIALLNATYALLAARAIQQPQGFVHRDYHSRNLMLTDANSPGIIDFQDAVHGPITYDIASLLRDSYIEWPDTQVEHWLRQHHQALCQNQPNIPAWSTFKTDFDWMSAQRHLKVLGIFARLHHRDGKSGYLADLPLTLRNLHRSLAPYAEFAEFIDWLNTHGCARP
ncbi:MAG: aminoglycoside phosphotransferase family protein [Halothiobacillaceae bacterium]